MRRIATVIIAAPLAACAARITSIDGYFPVPTINRESNSRAAIFSASVVIDWDLPSRYRFDDFDAVAVVHVLRLVLASANHAVVARHRDAVSLRTEQRQQRADGELVRQLVKPAVDRCLHA
jgi:hypothetical protein